MPDLGRQFGDVEQRVTPMTYGIPIAVDAIGPGSLRGILDDVRPHHVREVPIGALRATQSRLDPRHAEDIAGTPKRTMDRRKKMAAGYVNPVDNSVWLEDGHHRAAGAVIRGDETLRTLIKGYVAPTWQGAAGGHVVTRADAEEHLRSRGGDRA